MQSESEAMVAMTSAVLPPPSTPRLGPVLCGWWSEMWRKPYRTIEDVERDMRSIDFAVECGIDIVADARVWAGEPQKVSSLRNDEKFELGELPRKLAEYARRKGVRWMFWASMGNSEPWCEQERMGKPFRPDKPEWLMTPYSATCFGYRPSFDWLAKTILDAMEAGQYGAWSIDGDFFGGPGFDGGPGWNGGGGPNGEPGEPWVHPARCESKLHDHVNPDINCICQRHLTELARILRQRYPDVYTFYSRPTMDLGVWALRHVDACWTINEWAGLEGIPGMEPQPKNVLLGDKIRHWSRMRVHQHFFPHYLDSSLVFDAPKSMLGLDSAVVFDAPQSMPNRDWTSEKIDYIMLSALSSSPNQIFYLPSQAGIPAADKREIKKWLDWGRANLPYIMVRKDLPDWPAPGKVDGSAHIVGRQGLVFLFNPNKDSLPGEFSLSEESIGLKGDGAGSSQNRGTRRKPPAVAVSSTGTPPARAIDSGVVPAIRTPDFASCSARLSGVCPPSWTTTASGFSASMTARTSSIVSGSKMMISSIRFRNSGRNVLRIASSIALWSATSCGSPSGTKPSAPPRVALSAWVECLRAISSKRAPLRIWAIRRRARGSQAR